MKYTMIFIIFYNALHTTVNNVDQLIDKSFDRIFVTNISDEQIDKELKTLKALKNLNKKKMQNRSAKPQDECDKFLFKLIKEKKELNDKDLENLILLCKEPKK